MVFEINSRRWRKHKSSSNKIQSRKARCHDERYISNTQNSFISYIYYSEYDRKCLLVLNIIEFEKLSTREKMSKILDLLIKEKNIEFHKLCEIKEGRIGIIVNFLAMLELVKDSLITLIQSEDFGQIHLSAKEEIH